MVVNEKIPRCRCLLQNSDNNDDNPWGNLDNQKTSNQISSILDDSGKGWLPQSLHPPKKSKIDTKNDGCLKCISFQIWPFWVSMFSIRGCKPTHGFFGRLTVRLPNLLWVTTVETIDCPCSCHLSILLG